MLTATDHIEVWSLFVLAALIGTVNAFDTTVRSSFTFEMVGADDITGAVGVGSTVNNVSRIVGPAIAGAVIAWAGIAACFFANSASYLVCIVAFLLMRRAEFEPKPEPKGSKGQVREGLRVVWDDPRLRTPMLMTLVIGTLAYENQIALPLLAKFTFGGDAGSYGLLSSALGVGSVIGGLVIARSGRATHRRLGLAALFLGVAMLLASAMPSMGTAVAAMVVVGVGSVAFITMTSATLQLNSRADMRGRVLALYVTAIIGTTPVGGPIIGWIGEVVGPRATYVTGGVACILTAAVAWRSLARSNEETVSDEDAADIERRAVREAEEVEADSASCDAGEPQPPGELTPDGGGSGDGDLVELHLHVVAGDERLEAVGIAHAGNRCDRRPPDPARRSRRATPATRRAPGPTAAAPGAVPTATDRCSTPPAGRRS